MNDKLKGKIYSGVSQLPKGDAAENVTEGCLVLEGGAFRGVYTNGVLDRLMQEGINLRTTYGVSAGALNAINYVAGQIGRSARINLTYRLDSRYVGKDAIRNNKGIIGFDFVFGELEGVEPLNKERILRGDRELFAVATCLETGKPEALGLTSDINDLFLAVRASASLPYISRAVTVGEKHYLDGGCSCKVPHSFALERGFEKIVVVRTRPRTYRKQLKSAKSLSSERIVYRKYPEFAASVKASNDNYNRQCDELEALEAKGRIFVIAPSEPVTVSRLEKDIEKLGRLYHLGYNDAGRAITALKKYLAD